MHRNTHPTLSLTPHATQPAPTIEKTSEAKWHDDVFIDHLVGHCDREYVRKDHLNQG